MFLYEKVLKERKNFPKIGLDQFKRIKYIWEGKANPADVVVQHEHLSQVVLSYKNLRTLSSTNWLNDEVRSCLRVCGGEMNR